MKVDLLETLNALKGAWMIGSSGVDKSPVAWKSTVHADVHPELGLMALAGQAIQYALKRVPGGPLQATPLLPRLRLPPPPWPARQHFRNLIRAVKITETEMIGLIRLFAARGYSVHPLDFLPKHFSKLPEVYAPWDTWQRAEVSNSPTDVDTIIDSGNWDMWSPADRRQALSSLRRCDPDAARALIGEKATSLAADERFRVIEILAEGLSSQDQPTLEAFTEDRSSKIRQLVKELLARLGLNRDDPSDISEFADFFVVTQKTPGSGIKVKAIPLKTDAQKKRRDDLAELLSIQSFVQGLKLDNEAALVDGWEPVEDRATDMMVRMVAATGSSATVALLASRITSLRGITAETFRLFFDRMSNQSRLELLPGVLENDDASFAASLTCCQSMLGVIPWQQLEGLSALKKLTTLSKGNSSMKTPPQERLREGLHALGLLVDQATAGRLIQEFINENLLASDPILGPLRINQCLPPGEPL